MKRERLDEEIEELKDDIKDLKYSYSFIKKDLIKAQAKLIKLEDEKKEDGYILKGILTTIESTDMSNQSSEERFSAAKAYLSAKGLRASHDYYNDKRTFGHSIKLCGSWTAMHVRSKREDKVLKRLCDRVENGRYHFYA